ncbi:MAG TPA: hypothetical protein VEH79_00340 [Gaiellaceae bacterium]|nr:hypothetical protein [Gaiellaceae bacterium]
MRRALPAAILAALLLPQAASAHAGGPSPWQVTTSQVVRLPDSLSLSGGSARVRGKTLELELSVPPSVTATVLGYLGEPFLRFDRGGVAVAAASPTAAATRLVTSPGVGWKLITRAHSLEWSDRRIQPPTSLSRNERWSVPIVVSGVRGSIVGTTFRLRSDPAWPWLLGFALATAGALATSRRVARRRASGAIIVTAGVAVAAAATNLLGYAFNAGTDARAATIETAAIAVLLAAALLLAISRPVLRRPIAVTAASVAGLVALDTLPVLWRPIVLSALPTTSVRLLLTTSLAAACACCGIALIAMRIPEAERKKRRSVVNSRERRIRS